MIVDHILNASCYFDVHPRFKKAFNFLTSIDFIACDEGIYEVDDNIKMIVSVNTLKNKRDAPLETHQKYIDIHIPISQPESFGWKSAKMLEKNSENYNTEKDYELFPDHPTSYFIVQPKEFAIFLSNDAHAPLIGTGELKKIIFKILID
ncbi:MAG: YhcH/YjgK/YiaL family protein [Dysgonamonadaceae bacterium]|nr:YhcH/YjgK/YiaL family protein [Dysgonamonadaceae bacterium]MDD4728772.1 YhcH/YjgK/YiaL family protein [Dysgonamonadaceae bacterium]